MARLRTDRTSVPAQSCLGTKAGSDSSESDRVSKYSRKSATPSATTQAPAPSRRAQPAPQTALRAPRRAPEANEAQHPADALSTAREPALGCALHKLRPDRIAPAQRRRVPATSTPRH